MIKIIDDVLDDPLSYLAETKRLEFQNLTFGPDTFKGIAQHKRRDVDKVAESATDARSVLSFFRRSPKGQQEPNYVHSDEMMGRFTGIYYMNPEPPKGDGTAFWKIVNGEWEMTRFVTAKFNRLLIFNAEMHHSRALFDNYGYGENARLIQVVFLK